MLKLPTRQTAPQSAKTLWKNANLKVRDFLNSMCFSGPSFLGMLIFYLVPFGVVIYYSFIAGVVDNSFVGLKNYIAVFNNAAFRTAAKNTAVFTGLAVPLAVVLSMLFKPDDGAHRVHHPDLAGAVPFERRRQRIFDGLRRGQDQLAEI